MIKTVFEKHTVFGMNFTEKEKMCPIGCTARVLRITKQYESGEFDIVIEGVEKYILHETTPTASGLLFGSVDIIQEKSEQATASAVSRAIALYSTLIEHLLEDAKTRERFFPSSEASNLSYYIAEKTGLENFQKQDLLETPSESQRLSRMIERLEKLIPLVKKPHIVEQLVRCDGYLARNFTTGHS